MIKNIIKSYEDKCTEKDILFNIKLTREILDKWKKRQKIEKELKLTSSISSNNMHVFDENNIIRKISSPEEILFRFFKQRQKYYVQRKAYILDILDKQLIILTAKINFIEGIINDKILVFRKKKRILLNN